MTHLILKCKSFSPRLIYVADFVFGYIFGLSWEFQSGETDEIILISSNEKSLRLKQQGILLETGIYAQTFNIYVQHINSISLNNLDSVDNLDLLGIVFFYLSRYEEYIITDRDIHNRFSSRQSPLRQCHQPIVDILLHHLKIKIEHHLHLELKKPTFKFISTIDIDYPWYRKNLKFPYYINKSKYSSDPFDYYAKIKAIHKNSLPLIFWLSGGNHKNDVIKRYRHSAIIDKFNELKNTFNYIHIHPSYESGMDSKVMSNSIAAYKQLNGGPPSKSRQHYLRISIPDTYRLLIDASIQEDYSMGFSDNIGFRAGTAHAFKWYDLEKEISTSLRIFPLIAMDVTLKNHLQLSSSQALAKLKSLFLLVKKYGGNFILLWHNSSLSSIDGWEEYRQVYYDFIAYALKEEKP